MKKIIVTGSEGLIGTEICKYFEKNNNNDFLFNLTDYPDVEVIDLR